MFEKILIDQNPQWEGHAFPASVAREAETSLEKYLPLKHVISIAGVRRSGKSTLVRQAMAWLIRQGVPSRNIVFGQLEHPFFVEYAADVRHLERWFDDYLNLMKPEGTVYCCLDEVQFFADWPVFVKAKYESSSIKFMVTGSNSFLLSSDLLTLLSGRTLPISVFPLSFAELVMARLGGSQIEAANLVRQQAKVRQLVDEYLRYGGFPEVALDIPKELADEVLENYAKSILYQDVAGRLGSKKPLAIERLFYYLAGHVGTRFSYVKLAEPFGLTDKTVKEYVDALQAAYLLFVVDQFSVSVKQQVRSSKKAYLIDPGMAQAIAFKFSENRGRVLENAVFLELMRRHSEVYYYRTDQGDEVDFITKSNNAWALVQVCAELNEDALEREVRALVTAAKECKLDKGLIVTLDEAKEWQQDGIQLSAIPFAQWALSKQA
ncbi:MAG: ATP-binding protein [Chlamydiia bacterium]